MCELTLWLLGALALHQISSESSETCDGGGKTPSPVDPLHYVRWSEAGIADGGAGRQVITEDGPRWRVARGLITEHEASTFTRVIREMKPDLNKLDSIDRLPAYELYLRNLGVDQHPAARALPALEARLAAFVADHYQCSTCYACSVLLRRYRSDERRGVTSHYDRNAFLTAVVSTRACAVSTRHPARPGSVPNLPCHAAPLHLRALPPTAQGLPQPARIRRRALPSKDSACRLPSVL